MMRYGNWSDWHYDFVGVGVIIFFVLLMLVAVAVTRTSRNSEERRIGETAREILDQRLARGEVNPEEYAHLRELMAEEPAAAREVID
jgi:putative membrane protein